MECIEVHEGRIEEEKEERRKESSILKTYR